MSAIPIDWKPNTRKLREFAVASLIIFSGMGVLFAVKHGVFHGSGHWLVPGIFWALGAWGLLGVLVPALAKPLYLALMAVAMPIGFVISHVLLGLVYFGLFTPLALFFRLVGRDALQRKIDPAASSYWIQTSTGHDPSRYFRQF